MHGSPHHKLLQRFGNLRGVVPGGPGLWRKGVTSWTSAAREVLSLVRSQGSIFKPFEDLTPQASDRVHPGLC